MISVYLDSQDYSTLSKTDLPDRLKDIKEKLLNYAASGKVKFYFSSLIVCEAAPTESAAVQYAVGRGDFLRSICGNNALRFHEDIINEEIGNLVGGLSVPIVATCDRGDWFPVIDFPEPPDLESMVKEVINEEASNNGMSRQQRRAASRKVIKKGKMKPEVMKSIRLMNSESYVSALMSQFPMMPESADVFRRYCLGDASKEEAGEEFRRALRNPHWLMRWFASNEELAEPFVGLVRNPGRKMGDQIRKLALLSEDIRGLEEFLEESPIEKKHWKKQVDATLTIVASNIAKNIRPNWCGELNVASIADKCPGYTSIVYSIFSSVWDNVSGSKKDLPTDSQFPDAMHSVYAPYVDLFRADKYMAPHIRKQIRTGGAEVVPKLVDLPKAIEQRLRAVSPA